MTSMPRTEKNPHVFKILLLGDKGVGKTSLFRPFADKSSDPHFQSSIGVQFMIKDTCYDNQSVKFIIWDLTGHPKHDPYLHLYYRNTKGVILVYDITRADSIEHLPRLLRDVSEITGSDIKIAVLGNKSDLTQLRAVPRKDGEFFAKSINAEIFSETNIKTGQNVEAVFLALAKALDESNKKYNID